MADGTGVAGGRLSHLRSRLAGVEPADQNALPYRVGASGRDALVVVLVASPQAIDCRAVHDVEMRPAEPTAQHHDVLHLVVVVHLVRLRKVSKGLVDEHSGQDRIQDHGVLSALDLRRFEQPHGFVGHVPGVLVQLLHKGEIAVAAQADSGLLHVRAVSGHRREANHHVHLALLNVRSLGVGEVHRPVPVGVAYGGALNRGNAPHDTVVLVQQSLLHCQWHLSRVFLDVGRHHLHPGIDRREADPLSPHHSSLAHGQRYLLPQIREVVEADEPPPASHQRPRVTSPGAARADVLKLPAGVADMVGHGLLQPDFDIVGVVAPNGILYQVSQVPLRSFCGWLPSV